MALIHVRIDDGLKDQTDKIFSRLGLNMSTAINIFLSRVARDKGIPFDMFLDEDSSDDSFYSEANMAVLRESIQQMKDGNVIPKTMEELRELE